MAVHIFVVNENNYEICIQRGLVGLPEASEGRSYNNVYDSLLSRISVIKEDDFILMYVIGTKELRGVWQADGRPFYDSNPVWEDRIYPFRCKIKASPYYFENSLQLNDIYDLRNNGKIWTWALQRSSGTNAMFSISNQEFDVLLDEFVKINPFSVHKERIMMPYAVHDCNVLEHIHMDKGNPQYESSVMAFLNNSFAEGKFKDIFGNYEDYLCYVPTNLGREMDILLIFLNPIKKGQISSYDIIEVKRDAFDGKALTQLIDYEAWFLQKKVNGDSNMVRTTAIAKSYTAEVIDYVKSRTQYEHKPIKLLTYGYSSKEGFVLKNEMN